MEKNTKFFKLFLCANLIFGATVVFSAADAMKSQSQSINESCKKKSKPVQSGGTWEKKEGYDEYIFKTLPKITLQCSDSVISQEEKQDVVSCLEKNFNSSNNIERVYRLVKVGPNAPTCKCGNITKPAGVFSGLMVVRGDILWIEMGGNGYKDGLFVELPPLNINFSTTPSFVHTVGFSNSSRHPYINLPIINTAHGPSKTESSSCLIPVDRSKSPIRPTTPSLAHCDYQFIPPCRGAHWLGINLYA